MTPALGYAGHSPTENLKPFNFERRDPTARDVAIEILYCGVCHSDLHTVRNEWGGCNYPCVPGHEIVGRVTKVGAGVTKFKAGDLAAVGCMVDSCQECPSCKENLEQFCDKGAIFTYNSPDKHTNGVTYGGYSDSIVVDESFTLKVPANLDPAAVAPLLCAGITTYSPIKRWGIREGDKVGVVGLGGSRLGPIHDRRRPQEIPRQGRSGIHSKAAPCGTLTRRRGGTARTVTFSATSYR